jgi:hypothetical protein
VVASVPSSMNGDRPSSNLENWAHVIFFMAAMYSCLFHLVADDRVGSFFLVYYHIGCARVTSDMMRTSLLHSHLHLLLMILLLLIKISPMTRFGLDQLLEPVLSCYNSR